MPHLIGPGFSQFSEIEPNKLQSILLYIFLGQRKSRGVVKMPMDLAWRFSGYAVVILVEQAPFFLLQPRARTTGMVDIQKSLNVASTILSFRTADPSEHFAMEPNFSRRISSSGMSVPHS